ncbi:MAG: iron-containing alcohol dehydrogenase [Eubacteriales bacterium]|nr:iron-containing alcohol dehydrogenase [Eubacteriales bacterium]
MFKPLIRVETAALTLGCKFFTFREAVPVTGRGCRREIPGVLKKLGVKKVLVVTGRHVGKSIAPEIIENIRLSGLEAVHYSEVTANPTTTTVYEIKDMYMKEGCDGFLAVGGGSPIDAAKAAACLCARPRATLNDLAGLLKIMKNIPPFVAVPTTSGTGSETTMAAVVTDAETHHKYAIMDPHIIPDYAVMDPELVVGLPQKTTSATGMDALCHAVESYVSVMNKPEKSRRYAEEATVLIFRYLERAYNDGSDMEAREKLMEAAYKAGWSFGRTGVGNVHAIAHTLGGLYNTAHGLANAVILPIVLEDYGKTVYKPLARLAELAGIKTDGSDEEKAKAFIAEIYAMNKRMDMPEGFAFIEEKDIPQMCAYACSEANPTYPVPVIYDKPHFEKLIREIKRRG